MKEVSPSAWPSQGKEKTVEKTAARDWFVELRNRLCSVFEKIEEELEDGPNAHSPPGKFKRKTWQREGGGGGEMSLMRGRVFEKVGVNVSTVFGVFEKKFQGSIPGTEKDLIYDSNGDSMKIEEFVKYDGWYTKEDGSKEMLSLGKVAYVPNLRSNLFSLTMDIKRA